MSENIEQRVMILDIPFDKVTLKQATIIAIKLAKSGSKHQIATPNPEILLEAKNNPQFSTILKKSALNIPDGIGILWASKYQQSAKGKANPKKVIHWISSLSTVLFKPKAIREFFPERVTGTDLMQEICKLSPSEDLKIFLLGAKETVAAKAKEILESRYRDLQIVGTHSGSPQATNDQQSLALINQAKPDILFVAYGAPVQEFWIDRNLNKLETVKLAVGVGGAFDFIVGTKKRAPKIMQKMGLEWLFRLIQEPKRIKRIYNATIKFPITILTESLKKE